MDDLTQRFWGGRNFADVRMRKFHDEKQFGGHQHPEGRDHRVVHGGFVHAVHNRAAKEQPARQKDDRPQRPGWADVGASLEYPFCACLAHLVEVVERRSQKLRLSIGARLDLRVCGVEALQRVIGLREGAAARGYGPLGYGCAFVVQQALANPVAVGLIKDGEVPGQRTPAAPSIRVLPSALLI